MSNRTGAVVVVVAIAVAAGAFAVGRTSNRQEPVPVAALETPARAPAVPSSSTVRQAAGLSEAFVEIAQAVTPAVVRIETERTIARTGIPFAPRWLRGQGEEADSMAWEDMPELAGGTGIIISSEGHILTNNHVVEGADRVTVELADKRSFEADVVGLDPTTDLAVIRVAALDLPVARLGDSDESRVGEWVLAVGNPGFGGEETLDFTVTSGIISAKGRPLNVIGPHMDSSDPAAEYAIEDFIQTDAVINPGNSGGPLVNLSGLVIGINTAIASSTGFNQGYGFAIPANLARRVARDLIENGRVRRPVLGVSVMDVAPEDAEVYRLPSITGVLVYDLASGSPAEAAGMRRHDVIVAVDGERVDRVGQLQRLIAQRDPGDTVRLGLIRYGDSLQYTIPLAEAHIEAQAMARASVPAEVVDLGLDLVDLDHSMSRRLGFAEPGGVLIADVVPLSPADRKQVVAGLRLLSISGSPVSRASEARAILRSLDRGVVVSLVLEGPGGNTYIANIRKP